MRQLELLAALDHAPTLSAAAREVSLSQPAASKLLNTLAADLGIALFERAGLDVDIVDEVSGLVWDKLAVNAAVNPLTALLRVPNGALVESEWARRLMGQAAQEVAAVTAAQQITLRFPDAAGRVEQAARLTASNHSSMLQDVLRHAETEIEAICGAVVRAGETWGVPTPVNRLFYELIKALENTYNHQ
jgi:2-dehydropantoate 2-reductase